MDVVKLGACPHLPHLRKYLERKHARVPCYAEFSVARWKTRLAVGNLGLQEGRQAQRHWKEGKDGLIP